MYTYENLQFIPPRTVGWPDHVAAPLLHQLFTGFINAGSIYIGNKIVLLEDGTITKEAF